MVKNIALAKDLAISSLAYFGPQTMSQIKNRLSLVFIEITESDTVQILFKLRKERKIIESKNLNSSTTYKIRGES